jgi:endoglucanase
MGNIIDPADNFAFEVHQYLDSDSSGTKADCVSAEIGAERLVSFVDWARENGFRAFLGEFGAPSSDVCLHAIDNLLKSVGENNDVWIGWTWWSAGPWWGGYPMSIEPGENGEDKPQTAILSRHL